MKLSRTSRKGSAVLVLVERKDDEPRVDSRAVAQELGVKHKNTLELVERYRTEFESLGHLPFETEVGRRSQGGGKAARFALLNESQCTFLLTLSRNTPQVVSLKLKLTKLFEGYKRAYVREARAAERRAELTWQTQRREGKLVRRQETDAIKLFVAYAEVQGSKNARRYYVNITQMEYRALGFLELNLGDPLRDRLNICQLGHLQTAESIVAWKLREGMASALPYKDIFQLAKAAIEAYVATIPPTTLTHETGPKQLLLGGTA